MRLETAGRERSYFEHILIKDIIVPFISVLIYVRDHYYFFLMAL